jgi:hypothetical protein
MAAVEHAEDIGTRLAAAIEAALPGWVEREVRRILLAFSGTADPAVMREAAEAGRRAAADVGPVLRRLVAADVDEQWTNPLTLVRQAVRYPTEVLLAAGIPGVVRDEFDETHFPDDEYGLTPLKFSDVDPGLAELGFEWGAAKAMAHKARHRA